MPYSISDAQNYFIPHSERVIVVLAVSQKEKYYTK